MRSECHLTQSAAVFVPQERLQLQHARPARAVVKIDKMLEEKVKQASVTLSGPNAEHEAKPILQSPHFRVPVVAEDPLVAVVDRSNAAKVGAYTRHGHVMHGSRHVAAVSLSKKGQASVSSQAR